MIVNQGARTFESNTANKTKGFTIAASSKAFQILSDQLYTDKPRAILRELSTNALDAHIAAGKADVPFEVQLPTTWDSTLIVKDYGTGLSPEQIESLYTTYFGSDKSHTNDLVGGLGLGSKSPFSYTDQFTAVSRHHGTKYTYAAFIGMDSTPQITLISQEATDETNGFEVHVPVKESDIYTFEKTAQRVFEYFDVKPTLNRAVDFVAHTEPLMVIQHGAITAEMYSSQNDSVVMQGPIGYPIDRRAAMTGLSYSDPLYKAVEKFLNAGWRIKAPVGTFEITASREALSYNKDTIAAIKDLAVAVLAHIKHKMLDKLASVTSPTEAATLIKTTEPYVKRGYLDGTVWNGLAWMHGNFQATLPPDVECRVITKRRYGRSKDPHEVELESEHILIKGDTTYECIWSDKQRPYKQWLGDRVPLEKNQVLLYFTGNPAIIKSWLASLNMPAPIELPKPVRAAPGTKKVANYGAKKYDVAVLDITGQRVRTPVQHYTANVILAEDHARFLLFSDNNDINDWRELIEKLLQFKLLKQQDTPLYFVVVPQAHSRVRKALKEHPGYMDVAQARKDLLISPRNTYRKIASISGSIAAAEWIDKNLPTIETAFNVDEIEDARFKALMHQIVEVKNVPYNYVTSLMHALRLLDVDLYTSGYELLVQHFKHATLQRIKRAAAPYTFLTPVLKDLDDCTYSYRRRDPDNKLRFVLTEWVNTKLTSINQEAA